MFVGKWMDSENVVAPRSWYESLFLNWWILMWIVSDDENGWSEEPCFPTAFRSDDLDWLKAGAVIVLLVCESGLRLVSAN
jgi:hypothetical protein